MKTELKPFAPFGAIFHQMVSLKIKIKYSPFFFCGKYAYEEAKNSLEHGQLALCLPGGQVFDDYAWPVNGLRLILFDTGQMSAIGLKKLAYSILKQGAEVVGIYSVHQLSTDVYTLKKDLPNGKGPNK